MSERLGPLLFFVSGAAGLLYQTLWARMLIRVFGVTVYATTTTVAVFMAGLALGAALGDRFGARNGTLRRWGALEIGAAATALASSLLIPFLPQAAASLSAGAALRAILTAAVLMPPTVLMGATLPVLVGAFESARTEQRVALLYGVNTLGAVAGTLVVGFVAIAALGERGTLACAIGLQLAVGLIAVFAPPLARQPNQPEAAPPRADAVFGGRLLGVTAAVAGFCGLACELAWMRLAVFLVGSSVYGFSCVLAAFLAGIGSGSFASRRLSPSAIPALVAALGVSALLSVRVFLWIGLATPGREYLYSPLTSPTDVLTFLGVAAAVVFPFAFISGALFPTVVRAATTSSAASAVGRIYAINTLGAVLGAVVAGFVAMAHVGAQGTLYWVAIAFFTLAAALAFAARQARSWKALVGVAVGVTSLLAVFPQSDVTREILARRLDRAFHMRIAKHVETIDTTVTIAVDDSLRPTLLLNGIATSTKGKIGEAMAHLPLALQRQPERALVICFGVGSTFAAASSHVARVDAVELVGEVVASFAFFDPERAPLLTREGNRVFVDDGRNFLLRSQERWDAIVIDGAPPLYSAGFVNLYSREMFDLAREHLTDQGVLLVFVPTLSYRADVWGITRALTDAFPHTAMWTSKMSGYMLLASKSALPISRESIDAHLAGRQGVPSWFNASLLFDQGRFVLDRELRELASGWEPVTDDHPRCEYPLSRLLAGEPAIREPDQLFTEGAARTP